MNHHRHTHLVIFFAAVLLLLAAWPTRGQQQFTVMVDTVYLTAGEDMPIDYNDYSLRYKQTFPFYEDDRYTVFYERHWHLEGGGYVIFEEKETNWYPVTKNGWLQYEPVHRRYLYDGTPGRIVRTDSVYYLVYQDHVCSFDIGENPGQIGYLNELPSDDIDFPWVSEKWYYPDKVGKTLFSEENLTFAELDVMLEIQSRRLVDTEIFEVIRHGVAHIFRDTEEMIDRITACEDDGGIISEFHVILPQLRRFHALNLDKFLKIYLDIIFFNDTFKVSFGNINRFWL